MKPAHGSRFGTIDMLPERASETPSSLRTGGGKHVLIVDDDPAMRSMLTEYLEDENFKVTAVADGDGMATVLREATVDLIVLDMKLGREDGLDLMRRLGSPPGGSDHHRHRPTAGRSGSYRGAGTRCG